MAAKEAAARTHSQDEGRSPEQRPSRPWRAEGLPTGRAPQRRPRWRTIAAFVPGYAIFFGRLTVQDRMSGPQSIPYTELKAQAANKNVREVFAHGNTTEGALRKPVPLPGGQERPGQQSGTGGRTYQEFTTGAESDRATVTRIARFMAGRWGMSERTGKLPVLPAEGDPRIAGGSEEMLHAVDEELRRITNECYAEARRLRRENRSKRDRIVEQLLVRETLEGAEVYAAAGVEHSATPVKPVTAGVYRQGESPT